MRTHRNRHTDRLFDQSNSIFRWTHGCMIPSDMALQRKSNITVYQNWTLVRIACAPMLMAVPIIGGFLLVACDVSFAPPLDVSHNNKIAKITVNTDRATIKYFSNLVRDRHSVILCMQELKREREENIVENENAQVREDFNL